MFVLKITFSDVELRWDLGCLGMENLVTLNWKFRMSLWKLE